MKTRVKKIDIGKTKKAERRSGALTYLLIVIACIAGYYAWTHPVGLEARDALDRLIGPIRQWIGDSLKVD